MDHAGRQIRLRELLIRNRIDSLLVTHLSNIRYLSGFTGSAAALLITESGSVFFSDGRYSVQARTEVRGAKVVIVHKAPLQAAADWIRDRARLSGTRIGIEAENLSVSAKDRLKANLGSRFRLKSTSGLVERLRMVKDEDEVSILREAVNLGAKLFDRTAKVIRSGVSETAIAGALESAARDAGAESMAFPTIIASGVRSALPHGRASRDPIAPNGFVVCDFGVILAGYCSDQTRTVHIGKPSEEARRLYDAVREAQQAGINAVRLGRVVGDVDQAARRVLQRAKLGRYFTHSTGHGVGLEIHEAPRVAAGQMEPLVPGMVITIEPGAYIPGKGGVRIEDMVVVTNQGCEVLTPTGKELIVV